MTGLDMNQSIDPVLAALLRDDHIESGWVKRRHIDPARRRDEAFIAGFGWIRADGSHVSGGSVVQPYNLQPGWIDRWRIRRAVRAWAKRRHCHLEGHDPAQFQRKGTRRPREMWSRFVAEEVTQTREQCRRCGKGLTDWEDGWVRSLTGWSGPATIHERIFEGDGDWSDPREVTP